MNIKTRLSIQFTLNLLGVLLIFSVLVYYFSYSSQLSKFRQNLLVRAQNTAILLINVHEVDSLLLKKIYQSTKSLENEEIAIINSSGKLIFGNEIAGIKEKIKSEIINSSSPVYYSTGNKDGVLYNHMVNNQLFHVYVIAFDKYRYEKMRDLKEVIFWSILFSIWLSVAVSYFFAKLAIEPISNIIAKVKEINSSKLSSRLDEGKKQDEIEQLAVTFNEMLADLESVFKLQDEFVTNASHELRTPLAIMIAESDYILSKTRTPEEYEMHISTTSNDLRKLNLLLNSLLELAHLNRNNFIPMSVLRLDEPILRALQSIKPKYPGRKVVFKIESSENETDLLIKGNSGLLEIAFKNLIDNACKFSSGDVEVVLSKTEGNLVFQVKDKGIGVPAKEIDMIFHPFLRGTNVKYIGGFGVGLALVAKIVELHNATIQIKSAENQGSEFTISFDEKFS